MTLSETWPALAAMGFDVVGIMADVKKLVEVVLSSAVYNIAANSTRTHTHHANLFGFDVMLEQDGQARLIEVNSMPDFKCYSACQEVRGLSTL
jgi:D-alanine-D-alanine ligase-like ATP-grasp enzyme